MHRSVRALVTGLALAAFVAGASLAAQAASLRVSPVKLVVSAPGTVTSLTLRNTDRAPLNVQVRVFQSTMQDGRERLTPTADIVASPPIVTLKGGALTKVRVVRVAKSPVRQAERYRLVVDQIPDPKRMKQNAVNFLIRHVIAVDFTAPLAGLEIEPSNRTGAADGADAVRLALADVGVHGASPTR